MIYHPKYVEQFGDIYNVYIVASCRMIIATGKIIFLHVVFIILYFDCKRETKRSEPNNKSNSLSHSLLSHLTLR